MNTLARAAGYFRPYLAALLFSTLLNVSVAFTEAGLAIVIKPIFDEVFFGKNIAFLKWIPIVLLGLILLKGMFGFGHTYIITRVCVRVVVKLRAQMYQHYLRLSLAQFDHTPTGHMMSRITADVGSIEQTVPTLINMFRQIFTLLALLAVALYRDWQLTVIGLSVVPFTGIPVYFISKSLKRYQRKSLRNMGNLNTIVYEALSGIQVIKAFGTEKKETDKFKDENENYYKLIMRTMLIGLTASPLTEFITAVGVSVVFVLGGLHAIRGEITPGEFFSFIAAVMLMYRPVGRLNDIYRILQQLLAGTERVFQTLDEVPDVVDRPGARPIEPLKKEVLFNNVWFKYPPPQSVAVGKDGVETIETGLEHDWTLKGVDFTIRKGETVALVGSSGAGKTSISNLLPRFYDVTEGSVTIDGSDTRNATLESLRSQISLVTQEIFLFNETVRMNIAYGLDREVTNEEIEQAAHVANAHDFIMALPNKYDTVIGERGVKLSGGQRQRMAIARAILRNAPILILDEATSSLDTEAEQEVQKALEALMYDRTSLVIAHRLSTIRKATRIVVIDKGKKVEEGTHEELLEKGGIYKRLYSLQYFGETGDQAA